MNKLFYSTITDSRNIAARNANAALRLFAEGIKDERDYIKVQKKNSKLNKENLQYSKKVIYANQCKENMFDFYSASIILFQAMMESVINHEIDEIINNNYIEVFNSFKKGSKTISTWQQLLNKGSFMDKWQTSLKALDQKTTHLDCYYFVLCKPIRNLIVHPNNRNIRDIDLLRQDRILHGYESGWNAMLSLYDGLGYSNILDTWDDRVTKYELRD